MKNAKAHQVIVSRVDILCDTSYTKACKLYANQIGKCLLIIMCKLVELMCAHCSTSQTFLKLSVKSKSSKLMCMTTTTLQTVRGLRTVIFGVLVKEGFSQCCDWHPISAAM